MFMEEKDLKGKILALILTMTLLFGLLSGCIEEEEKEEEEENNMPVVSIDGDPEIDHNVTMAGGTVTFAITASDEDENDTLTFSWDFDDDETSADEDPVHVYTANGSYDVTVTVSDGTDTASDTLTVIVGNIAPVAKYTWVATNLSVNFTDVSTDVNGVDDIIAWHWDFDENETAYENETQGPVKYEFAAAGSYNVTLKVEDRYTANSYTELITVEE